MMQYETDLLSDSNLDIFRNEYPDYVVKGREAVDMIQDLNRVDDEVLNAVAVAFGISKQKLMALAGVDERILPHNTSTYRTFRPSKKYKDTYEDLEPESPSEELSALIEIIKERTEDNFMDATHCKTWWASRFRVILVQIAVEEIGLTNKDLVAMTGWYAQKIYHARKQHKEYMGTLIEYRRAYNSILEEYKEQF